MIQSKKFLDDCMADCPNEKTLKRRGITREEWWDNKVASIKVTMPCRAAPYHEEYHADIPSSYRRPFGQNPSEYRSLHGTDEICECIHTSRSMEMMHVVSSAEVSSSSVLPVT